MHLKGPLFLCDMVYCFCQVIFYLFMIVKFRLEPSRIAWQQNNVHVQSLQLDNDREYCGKEKMLVLTKIITISHTFSYTTCKQRCERYLDNVIKYFFEIFDFSEEQQPGITLFGL